MLGSWHPMCSSAATAIPCTNRMRVGAPLTMPSTTDRSLPYHDVLTTPSHLQSERCRPCAPCGPGLFLGSWIYCVGPWCPEFHLRATTYSNQTGHADCQKQQTLQGTTRAQHIVRNPPCPDGKFSRLALFGIGREGSPPAGLWAALTRSGKGLVVHSPRTKATQERWVENGWRAATNACLLTTPSCAVTPQAGRNAHPPRVSFRPGVGGFGLASRVTGEEAVPARHTIAHDGCFILCPFPRHLSRSEPGPRCG